MVFIFFTSCTTAQYAYIIHVQINKTPVGSENDMSLPESTLGPLEASYA